MPKLEEDKPISSIPHLDSSASGPIPCAGEEHGITVGCDLLDLPALSHPAVTPRPCLPQHPTFPRHSECGKCGKHLQILWGFSGAWPPPAGFNLLICMPSSPLIKSVWCHCPFSPHHPWKSPGCAARVRDGGKKTGQDPHAGVAMGTLVFLSSP